MKRNMEKEISLNRSIQIAKKVMPNKIIINSRNKNIHKDNIKEKNFFLT